MPPDVRLFTAKMHKIRFPLELRLRPLAVLPYPNSKGRVEEDEGSDGRASPKYFGLEPPLADGHDQHTDRNVCSNNPN